MKPLVSILAGFAFPAFAAIASAGVVVDEQQVINQPDGNKVTRNRTVMIEGNRQKSIIDNGNRTVITDLEKGTMTMIDGTRKSYIEFPFPPKGGGMAAMAGGVSPTIKFKKTGAHDKIIGYSCDDYSGAGILGTNSVSMSGCFSDSAPGAAEYSDFQRHMADKVKGTPMANMGQIPQGVPLRLTITTTMGPSPGMSGGNDNKLGQMLANRQFVTATTVSKLSTRTLPADSFAVPSGYQKQQLPPMLGGMGGGPMPPPAPHKVPE
jgi:hypothetical protein